MQHGSLQQLLQTSWGFTAWTFFCSSAEVLSHFSDDCCSNVFLGAWKTNKTTPQWNFVAVFKIAGQFFQSKCFRACRTGQGQAGQQGCCPGRDASRWASAWTCCCLWWEFGLLCLLCWWSAFLMVGMFLLSNVDLLLGWIIHRVIRHGRNFLHSIRFFFFLNSGYCWPNLSRGWIWLIWTENNFILETTGSDVIMKY